MAINLGLILRKCEKPVLYTTLGALLLLAIKNCGDGNKARETNEFVKDVAAGVDTIKQERRMDADTVKHIARETNKVVHRVEKKVDKVQETADSILVKVDDCCGCNKKPVVKPIAPVKKDTVPAKPVVDTIPVKKPVVPVKRDTVWLHDTICPKEPVKKETPKKKEINIISIHCEPLWTR